MTKKQKAMLSRIIAAFIIYITLAVTDHMEILPEWLGLWGKMALYLVPYVLIGWDIVYKAFRNIRNGQVFDENFLMTVATFGAFGVGEYSEAVAVMLFYQVGEPFQAVHHGAYGYLSGICQHRGGWPVKAGGTGRCAGGRYHRGQGRGENTS